MSGLLLVLPGVLLLRALRVPGNVVASSPVYVPAASLAVLIVSGLAVDVVGPLVGVSEPLRTVPLAVGIELACAGLFAASSRAPATTAIPWRAITVPLGRCWPLLLPLIAAVGALRLNTGHGSWIAVVAVVGCLAVLAWAIARAPRLSDAFVTLIVFAVSLAVMWAYSLRGALVYGFDISTEYHAMHQAVLSGVWHFAHPSDAYGALPAVTVLPAELHFLTGASDLMVLKLLYPALTAMFPVGIYSLGRKVVESRWALVAASFIVVQNTFAQELPALARQEIAMVFFIATLSRDLRIGAVEAIPAGAQHDLRPGHGGIALLDDLLRDRDARAVPRAAVDSVLVPRRSPGVGRIRGGPRRGHRRRGALVRPSHPVGLEPIPVRRP